MPVHYSLIDIVDVQKVLRARGWAFQQERGIGLRLTKPDPNPANVYKTTGKRKRVAMAAVSREHLLEILAKSHTIEEAVEQIEAISTGAQLQPSFGRAGGAGVSTEVVEKLLTQRVQNAVSQHTEQMDRVVADQAAQIEQLQAQLKQAQQKRGPGRPKGSKNKAKGKAVPRGTQDDEPELTEEQQAAYERAMGNARNDS